MIAKRLLRPNSGLAAVALLAGALVLRPFGNFDDPVSVKFFLGAASLMCVGFLLAIRLTVVPRFWFWTIAILIRLVLFGMEPGNDVFRYIWEGEVQNAGYSPYCHAPDSPALASLRDSVWIRVQHTQVTAIYPPLAELAFRIVTAISVGVAAMKFLIVAADLTTCWLLVKRFGNRAALTYAWNPLVLYSFSGGGHYDSLFLLALTGALLIWEGDDSRTGRLRAVGLLGAGVALKWLCLPLLGWALWKVLRHDGPKRMFVASCVSAAPFSLAWLIVSSGAWGCPLFPSGFAHVARSAEALPAVAQWLLPGGHFLTNNSTYLVVFGMLCFVLLWRQSSIRRAGHMVLSAALLTTPMFHAWYATWITPFAVEKRSCASVALSISAFVYFWLHHTAGQPGGVWRQSAVEKLLLWGPFAAGLIWDYWPVRPSGKRGHAHPGHSPTRVFKSDPR